MQPKDQKIIDKLLINFNLEKGYISMILNNFKDYYAVIYGVVRLYILVVSWYCGVILTGLIILGW